MFNGDCVIEFWDRGILGGLGIGCLPVLREMWWFGFEEIERESVLWGVKEGEVLWCRVWAGKGESRGGVKGGKGGRGWRKGVWVGFYNFGKGVVKGESLKKGGEWF